MKCEFTEETAKSTYDAALAMFREQSGNFGCITRMYRRREIGDKEYLAARQAFLDAQNFMDTKEEEFISRMNALQQKAGHA